MLPSVAPHLVIRIEDEPIRIRENASRSDETNFGYAAVGGTRTSPYTRVAPARSRVVGAVLRAQGVQALFGVSGADLAHRHTALTDLWAAGTDAIRERLTAAFDLAGLVATFESVLIERLRQPLAMHPAVALLLASPPARIREAVFESGYSHRHVTAVFTKATGLTPKEYARVARFERAVALWGAAPSISLADLAVAAGYSDQPHLSREFKRLSGMTPGGYRKRATPGSRHVPLGKTASEVDFFQDVASALRRSSSP